MKFLEIILAFGLLCLALNNCMTNSTVEEENDDDVIDHQDRRYKHHLDEILNKTSKPIEDGTAYTEYRRNRITGEIYTYNYTYRAAKPYDPRKDLGFDFNSSIYTVDGVMLDNHIKTQKNVLVFVRNHFVNPGSILRHFYQTATKAKENNLPVRFLRICPPYFQNIDPKYNLYMPSVVLYKDYGEFEIMYEESLDKNKRSADELYAWLISRLGSNQLILGTKKEADEFIKNNTVATIAFFKEYNQTAFQEFDHAILHVNGPKFAVVIDKKISESFGIKHKYDVVIYHNNGEKKYPLLPEILDEDLGTYFEENYLVEKMTIFKNPPVIELVPGDLPTMESSFIEYDIFMFIDGGDPERKEILETFSRAVESYRLKVKAYLIDVSMENNQQLANERGVRIAQGYKRQRIVMNVKQNKTIRYRPEKEFWEDGAPPTGSVDTKKLMTQDEIESFIQKVLAKKVDRYYLSETQTTDEDDIIIEEAKDGAYGTPNRLKKVIGKNWKELCKDNTKTSVVYFTGSWCMGCNHTIHTRLTRLGLHYTRAGRTDLLLGFSDYSLNEYPGIKNETVPRLKIFPKGTDDEINLDGEEKYCNIKRFIETLGKESNCDPNLPRDPENIDPIKSKWVKSSSAAKDEL